MSLLSRLNPFHGRGDRGAVLSPIDPQKLVEQKIKFADMVATGHPRRDDASRFVTSERAFLTALAGQCGPVNRAILAATAAADPNARAALLGGVPCHVAVAGMVLLRGNHLARLPCRQVGRVMAEMLRHAGYGPCDAAGRRALATALRVTLIGWRRKRLSEAEVMKQVVEVAGPCGGPR